MFSCSNCIFWRSHGYSLGVCTFEPLDPVGTIAPVSADSVGTQLALEWYGSTATSEDTLCDNYEPDEDSLPADLFTEEEDD